MTLWKEAEVVISFGWIVFINENTKGYSRMAKKYQYEYTKLSKLAAYYFSISCLSASGGRELGAAGLAELCN
nr:10420_t:CDS:2 [Entrophospora candida]